MKNNRELAMGVAIVGGLAFAFFSVTSCVRDRDLNERDIQKACIEKGASYVYGQCIAGQVNTK